MVDLTTLSLTIGSATIDAINPSAIAVLALIAAVVLGSGRSTGRMLGLGALYILVIYITYLLLGVGLLYSMASIPHMVANYASMAIGVIAIVAGVLQLRDFFGISRRLTSVIPQQVFRTVERLTKRKPTVLGVAILGVFVALIELACTGAPYFVTLSVLHTNIDMAALLLMALYNIVFVSPLVVILVMVALGTKVSRVQRWKDEHTDLLRAGVGLVLIALGWLVLLVTNGVITFG